MMKYTVYILFILCLNISCKSAKNVTESKTEQTKLSSVTDFNYMNETQFKQLLNNYLNMSIREGYSVTIEKTVYDTDKPADPTTGKHPISEESKTSISGEGAADISASQSIDTEVNQKNEVEETRELDYDNASTSDKQVKELPVKYLMVLAGVILLIACSILIVKSRKR